MLLAIGIGFAFMNLWIGLGLIVASFLTWIIKPPAYQPRCPACGGTDIRNIIVDPATAQTGHSTEQADQTKNSTA